MCELNLIIYNLLSRLYSWCTHLEFQTSYTSCFIHCLKRHLLHLIFEGMLHDDVIKWKHFPRNWPFVRGIHRSPVNSLHKGQWRGALMFTLICARINDWVNNRGAGDLRRYRAHYDVIVMLMKWGRNARILADVQQWRTCSWIRCNFCILLSIVDHLKIGAVFYWWTNMIHNALSHWGRETYICVSKFSIIGSDNGLSPNLCWDIVNWTLGNKLQGWEDKIKFDHWKRIQII